MPFSMQGERIRSNNRLILRICSLVVVKTMPPFRLIARFHDPTLSPILPVRAGRFKCPKVTGCAATL